MNDRNAFTRKLFLDSGIEAGMRILDVGCGAGEVSFLMQEILGAQVKLWESILMKS